MITDENFDSDLGWNDKKIVDDITLYTYFDTIPFFTPLLPSDPIKKWTLKEKLRYNYETSLLLPEYDASVLPNRNNMPLSKRLTYMDKNTSEKRLLIGFTVNGEQIYYKSKNRVLHIDDIPSLTIAFQVDFVFDDIDLGIYEFNTFFSTRVEGFIYRAEMELKEKMNDNFYKVKLRELNDQIVKDDQRNDIFYIRNEDIAKSESSPFIINSPITPNSIYEYIRARNEKYVEASKQSLENSKNKTKKKKKKNPKPKDLIPPLIGNDEAKKIMNEILGLVVYDYSNPKDMHVEKEDFEKIKKIQTISEILLAYLFLDPFSDNSIKKLTLGFDKFNDLGVLKPSDSKHYLILDKHILNSSEGNTILVLAYNSDDKESELFKISVDEKMKGDVSFKQYDMSSETMKKFGISDDKNDIGTIMEHKTLHYIFKFERDFLLDHFELSMFMKFNLKSKIHLDFPLEIINLLSKTNIETVDYVLYLNRINNIFRYILDYDGQSFTNTHFWYISQLYHMWHEEKFFLDVSSLISRTMEIISILHVKDRKKFYDPKTITTLENEKKNLENTIINLEHDLKISKQKNLASGSKTIPSAFEAPIDINNYELLVKRGEELTEYTDSLYTRKLNIPLRRSGETVEQLDKEIRYFADLVRENKKKQEQFWIDQING